MRRATSFPRLLLKVLDQPIPLFISFQRTHAVFPLLVYGTASDFGPTLRRQFRWRIAPPIFSSLTTVRVFRRCSTWCFRFLIWERQQWLWEYAERRLPELCRI